MSQSVYLHSDIAGGWRNGLVFDPLEQYRSFSYTDFLLFPLADALNAVLRVDTQVWFAMQVRAKAADTLSETAVPYLLGSALCHAAPRHRACQAPSSMGGLHAAFTWLSSCIQMPIEMLLSCRVPCHCQNTG